MLYFVSKSIQLRTFIASGMSDASNIHLAICELLELLLSDVLLDIDVYTIGFLMLPDILGFMLLRHANDSASVRM